MSTEIQTGTRGLEDSLKRFSEERVTAAAVRFDAVNVEIDLGAEILSTYAEELWLAWDQATQLRGWRMPFAKEELLAYCCALVAMRVAYCQGKRVSIRPTDRIAVPSFLSVVLSNVGLTRDVELGIELRPIVKPAAEPNPHEDDVEWLEGMSRKIKTLAPLGVEYAEGYSRSRDGSYDFMTMALLEGEMRNIAKKPHPVYALLASTLGVRGIETVLSPRVTYGSVGHFASLVRNLAAVKL